MKILHIVPYVPALNSNGGAWRMFSILRGMAERGHEVHVLSFANTEEEVQLAEPLKKFCKDVRVFVRRPAYTFHNYLERGFLDNDFFMPELRDALYDMLNTTDFDVMHYEYYQMAPYITKSARKAVVFTDHENPFLVQSRRGKATGLRALLQETAMLLRTKVVLSQVDAFISLTSNDALMMQELFPKSHPEVVNTGIDLDFFAPPSKPGNPKKLVFVGYFLHSPNVDAMKFFVHEVLPQVSEKHPDVELSIVGKDPTPEVLALQSDRVHVTGFVPDTRPYMRDAGIYVVPIRVGAGFRGKILEAWSMGLPVISTTVAADGFDLQPGNNIVLADDAQSFAHEVVRLIDDADARIKLGTAGRREAEKYGWKKKIDELEALYTRILKEKGQT